jgi:hypothetical protein
MFASTACRFVLFLFISLSANAEKGGIRRFLDQSESTVDTSKGLAVVVADDAHRMLLPTEHAIGKIGTMEEHYIIDYADLGGKILKPGTYWAAADLDLTGTLTFVANNVKKPKWTIIIGGAFTTIASSKMIFQADLFCVGYGCAGSSSKVDWVVAGDITLGAGSTAVGNMVTPAAMTVGGAGDSQNPSFTFDTADTFTFTIGGALTMSSPSYMTKVDGATVDWVVAGDITVGTQSIAVGDMDSIFDPNN